MTDILEIEIFPTDKVPAGLNKQIDELDHLAFSGEVHDAEFVSIQWASHEWMAVGRLDGELVTQLCLLKREILVGGEKVWVTGIGGVATHPDWRRRGLASQVMRAVEDFIRHKMEVPFGLLICAEETRPLYEGLGWQKVAEELVFIQNDERRTLKTCTLILKITTDPFPQGLINLCGLPW